MRKEYFIDNLSIEDIAELTDEMLRFEKNNKNARFGDMKHIWKIGAAAAVIVLVIGLVNFMPMFNSDGGVTPGGEAAESVNTPPLAEKTQEYAEYADPYAHVRFGETRDILLLDVEWHTGESYEEYMKNWLIDYRVYLEDKKYSEEEILEFEKEQNKLMEKLVKQIAGGEIFISETVNGKESGAVALLEDSKIMNGNKTDRNIYWDYARGKKAEDNLHYDENGYYIYEIYPYSLSISYYDENGEYQFIGFGEAFNYNIDSKNKFNIALEDEAIPVCDDLLARGLITQEQYDDILKDPLQTAVERFFGTANDMSETVNETRQNKPEENAEKIRAELINNLDYEKSYDHVRFGETRDVLLLEVEWLTYETFMEDLEEFKTDYYEDYYNRATPAEREWYEDYFIQQEEEAIQIKEKEFYRSRNVNGKGKYAASVSCDPESYEKNMDSDGYYRWEVYPSKNNVYYYDEDGEFIVIRFGDENGFIYSEEERQVILENEIIPLCNELVDKGLIEYRDYDRFTVDSLLDYYVSMFFD